MGNYIVVVVLFIAFVGMMSLFIDSLVNKQQQKYYNAEKVETPATVILEESFDVDLDKFYN